MRSAVLVLAALFWPAGASAQMDVDDGDYWVDGAAPDNGSHSEGALTLEESRRTGRGIRLGGYLGSASVPDVYVIRRGDTLWDITGRYYGNPWQWPRVWSYNPEITNPHWIYPDDTLRLRAGAEMPTQLATDSGGAPQGLYSHTPQRTQPQSVLLRDEGYLDEDALEARGIIVGSPEEHMLLSDYDEVYVRFDGEGQVRPGQSLTVFREVDSDERTRGEQGVLVRIFGTVQVRSYDPERRIARAVIVESLDPIERGYLVANIPRRFEMVPPRENQRNVVAEVVATLRPRELSGDYQIVFVNVGEEQGVQVGNRFFVVQRGDEWRDELPQGERQAGAARPGSDEPDEYPDEIVAEARVVNVRPNSAGLMVTRSTMPVEIGDRVEMRQGY